MQQGYAYFVDKPRTIDDLMQPHRIEAERPFQIVKIIQLSGIDYGNVVEAEPVNKFSSES